MPSKQTLFVFALSLLASQELRATESGPKDSIRESCVDLSAFEGRYKINPNSCVTSSIELPGGGTEQNTQPDFIAIEMGADSSEDYQMIFISAGQEFSIASPQCATLSISGANSHEPTRVDSLSFEDWSNFEDDMDYSVKDSIEYSLSPTSIRASKKYLRSSNVNPAETSTESNSSWTLQVTAQGDLQFDFISETANWYESEQFIDRRESHCQLERVFLGSASGF